MQNQAPYQQNPYGQPYPYPNGSPEAPKKKKTALVITCLAVGVALFLILIAVAVTSIVRGVLENAKDSEQYRVAYRYFTESETFKALGVGEEEIGLNSYSYSYRTEVHGTSGTRVEYGFTVKGKSYFVVCHSDGETWWVCPDCTEIR